MLEPSDAATLVAVPDGDGLRFDITLQGERQTVFLAV
jgi:protocatechuate 3,4-dioxygenase beta subunit